MKYHIEVASVFASDSSPKPFANAGDARDAFAVCRKNDRLVSARLFAENCDGLTVTLESFTRH